MSQVVFKNFSYAYKERVKVLDTLNLTIPQGSFTVVTGPSGAGKTTLCLSIVGAVPHYFGGSLAGEVTINGMQTINMDMCDIARHVGIVLEDYESQLVTLTVREEIAFGLENLGMDRQEILIRTKKILALVGLEDLGEAKVGELSGGQKQRLAIAGALVSKPQILVLDEPSSALDPEGAESLYALLSELNIREKITIIVVEHDLSRVLAFASQLILLVKGQIAKAGTVEDVMRFMWQAHTYSDGIPPLWQLKLLLEEKIGYRLPEWRTEQNAIQDLQALLE